MKIAKIKTATFKFMGSSFTIQELRNRDIVDISEAAYPKTMEMQEHDGKIVPVRSMGTNSSLDVFLTFKKALVAWDTVEDGDGNILKCDEPGKDYFYANLPKKTFDEFYVKLKSELDKLIGLKKEQVEKQKKN